MVDAEFPHPVDWIFATMFPGQPEDPAAKRQAVEIVAIVYDGTSAAMQSSRSFLFQSALSVCDFGGSAAYFVKERMNDLPKLVRDRRVPNIFGLKKLQMYYKATSKELARTLAQISQTPSTRPVLFCVEDLVSFCEATARHRVRGFLRKWN